MNAIRSLVLLLVVLALQLVPGVGVGDARAAITMPTREAAYNACVADAAAQTSSYYDYVCGPYNNPLTAYRTCQVAPHNPSWNGRYLSYADMGANCIGSGHGPWVWTQECPTGSTWNEEQKKCFDPAVCLAKPALGFTKVHATAAWDNVCSDGCQYSQNSALDIQFPQPDGSYIGFTTGWLPNGNACSASDPTPAPVTPPQECLPAPDGLTFCIKPNGDHCYSASTGRQICWRPGQTGEKTDGDVLQQRAAGTAAGAPTPQTQPPPGESFAQQGPAHEVSESVNGVGINTVVINYGTVNGTNAGGSAIDQGENSDGTGGLTGGNSGSGSSGDGDEDGTVTGGVDCDNPPVVTGDPVLANVVLQTWGTRCAIESQNAVHSSGDIQDCHDSFVVTGPEGDPNVAKLQGIRAQICGHYGDENEDGQPDWTEGDAPTLPGEGEAEDEPGPPSALTVGTGLLDMGGMLGGSTTCPELGVIDFGPFGEFDLNSEPMWCDLVSVMRAVVLLMAAFAAIRILMGGK